MDVSPRASVRLRRGDKELTFNIEDMLVSDCGFCSTIDIYGSTFCTFFTEFYTFFSGVPRTAAAFNRQSTVRVKKSYHTVEINRRLYGTTVPKQTVERRCDEARMRVMCAFRRPFKRT